MKAEEEEGGNRIRCPKCEHDMTVPLARTKEQIKEHKHNVDKQSHRFLSGDTKLQKTPLSKTKKYTNNKESAFWSLWDNSSEFRGWIIILSVFSMVFGIVFIAQLVIDTSSSVGTSGSSASSGGEDKTTAWVLAKQKVSNSLKAPSSPLKNSA